MTDRNLVETKDDLTNSINEMFKRCEEEGMVFPFIACTISPNGSVLASRMDSIGCTKTLAQHFEPDGFKVPLSLVLEHNPLELNRKRSGRDSQRLADRRVSSD
jgi:hypothetical protein